MKKPLRVHSMFTGIGGLDLGLERAGMVVVSQCEIDPYCRKVLAKHWPGVPCHDDVTTREYTEGEADVVCGGFPCQDVSNAGKRAGLSAPRSGLYREVVRAIRVVRPLYGILENVAALLGRGMGTVLGDMAAIGYDAEWHCIPACSVGAPHTRDRVFVVAHPERRGGQGEGAWCRSDRGMGRESQPVPWNEPWECALRRFRGVDDGSAYGVDRTNGLRNAVVPQVAEMIGNAVMDHYSRTTKEPPHAP